MNAANEEAVAAFLNERISLTDIPQVIESVMNDHSNHPATDIETILAADHEARLAARVTIEEFSRGFTRLDADPIRVHP
jgi:1-deoxy-D-xylulose 5-phosphate reductoisomerase